MRWPPGAPPRRGNAGAPHLLVMSATPIPRTLGPLPARGGGATPCCASGPPGRLPPRTRALWGQPGRRVAYDALLADVEAGGRAFVICPAIGQGEPVEAAASRTAGGPRLARAERLWAWLGERLPGRVALCHGGLAPAEKAAALGRFREGAAVVLVATTVVEVGVDVPEASLAILVENAERFGLAQLHQLRGRVGRGGLRRRRRPAHAGAARARQRRRLAAGSWSSSATAS